MNPKRGRRSADAESKLLLVTGRERYIGEGLNFADMVHAYPIVSPAAHGLIRGIDVSRTQAVPGVRRVLLAGDIPGKNGIGASRRDEEPLLAFNEVLYVGQPVGIVLADTSETARYAAHLAEIDIEILEPIFGIREAVAAGSLYRPPLEIHTGDLEKAFAEADFVLEGTLESGAQEHLYLETQRALAIPKSGGSLLIHSATQGVTDVQDAVSNVLGLSNHSVEVDLMRVGGAFGGKERGGTMWAAVAALGTWATGLPCRIELDRKDDLAWTGKRHPFLTDYRAAFSKEGRILALDVELNANGGAFEDFTIPIVERAMLGVDGPYSIRNTRIIGRGCKTHLPSNTAFRGFGAPQASFVIESIMDRAARTLGKDLAEIQRINFYRDGEETPYGQRVYEAFSGEILDRALPKYKELLAEAEAFNAVNHHKKRGVGLLPVKYGIAFTATFLNQGNALIWVYMDGSISLSHGGVEMGQGLFRKVARIVARTLGVREERIKCETTNTLRIGSVASTAASSGTDINGYAAYLAAKDIRAELRKAASQMLHEEVGLAPTPEYIEFEDDYCWDKRLADEKRTFEALASFAYFNRYNLGAQSHFATPGLSYDMEAGKGTPFAYFSLGEAVVMAEVDLLTGGYEMKSAHIVHEGGEILDEAIDRGQITGGFLQGVGLCTMEDLRFDGQGRPMADSLSTYKVPAFSDLPEDYSVDLYSSRNEHASIFGSKGIGEPPLLYGLAAYFAVKHALEAFGGGAVESRLSNPATPEAVALEAERIRKTTKTGKGTA